MTRVADWDLRLFDLVDRYRSTPFDWTHSHCIHMAVDVLKAVRGDDAAVPEFPAFDSRETALATLEGMGCATLADGLAMHLEEVAPAMAQRGDLGTIENGTLVCVGAHWFGRSETGPVTVPFSLITRAFRT